MILNISPPKCGIPMVQTVGNKSRHPRFGRIVLPAPHFRRLRALYATDAHKIKVCPVPLVPMRLEMLTSPQCLPHCLNDKAILNFQLPTPHLVSVLAYIEPTRRVFSLRPLRLKGKNLLATAVVATSIMMSRSTGMTAVTPLSIVAHQSTSDSLSLPKWCIFNSLRSNDAR